MRLSFNFQDLSLTFICFVERLGGPIVKNLTKNYISRQSRSISVLRPEICDETSAKNFVSGLSNSEQEYLAEALSHVIDEKNGSGELTRKLLAKEAVYAG